MPGGWGGGTGPGRVGDLDLLTTPPSDSDDGIPGLGTSGLTRPERRSTCTGARIPPGQALELLDAQLGLGQRLCLRPAVAAEAPSQALSIFSRPQRGTAMRPPTPPTPAEPRLQDARPPPSPQSTATTGAPSQPQTRGPSRARRPLGPLLASFLQPSGPCPPGPLARSLRVSAAPTISQRLHGRGPPCTSDSSGHAQPRSGSRAPQAARKCRRGGASRGRGRTCGSAGSGRRGAGGRPRACGTEPRRGVGRLEPARRPPGPT
ncbi:hypothetical protein VULLAG_LOCUS316 [Vulpes lagopus]